MDPWVLMIASIKLSYLNKKQRTHLVKSTTLINSENHLTKWIRQANLRLEN